MKKIIDTYPREMRALVLHGVGDLRLEDVPAPPLTDGCVLLEIRACGICSSDRERVFVTGTYHFPTIPGHEFAGRVVAVADDVDEALLGRRASVFPMLPCMSCEACGIEQYAQCDHYDYFGSRRDGGFAEYLAVPVWNLVLYDDSVPYELAALSEPAAVGMHAVRLAGIKDGENVAVVGTGTIGFLVAAFARGMNAHVTIFGRSGDKLALARELGFDAADVAAPCPAGFDAVFEAVGSNDSIARSVALAGNFGRIVLLGNPKGDLALDKDVYWSILRKQKRLIGSWNSSYGSRENDWAEVADWMKRGAFDFGRLITHRFTMDDYKEAFDLVRGTRRDGLLLKAMIMIGG